MKGEPQFLTGIKLYSVVAAVSLSGFLASLDIAVIATAIPSITSHFHTTADIGWYGAAYPLCTCALQPLTGKLATIFSLRWVFQSFFSTFLLGSLICGAATSSNMFIVGRAIAGIGAAGISSGGMSIVAIVSPPKSRAMFTGMVMSVFSIGMVVSPIIGGALTENVSWRWCFYINLPTGAVTIAILLVFLHPPREELPVGQSLLQKLRLLDLLGSVLFAASMVMLFLALQWGGNKYSWGSATVIGLFVGFAVVAVLFFVWEGHRGDTAMIPFSLMKRRSIYVCFFYIACLGGVIVVPTYYLPEYFQVVKGVGPTASGIRLLPFVGMQTITMITAGTLARFLKYLNPIMIFGTSVLCIASGLFTTLSTFGTNAKTSHWVAFQVVQGLGTGSALQIPMILIPSILKDKPADIPLAISLILFGQFFGNAIFQAIAAAIYHNGLVKNLQDTAGLEAVQISQLLTAGNVEIRKVVAQYFPDKLRVVLEAYNGAITETFWLELAGALGAFAICFGLQWVDTRVKPPVAPEAGVDGKGVELVEGAENSV
ncbi:putative transporter [Mytilinidion resinicola]|uniref:Transporter n=1 Tax=Mytilinidion resinicola TaxID=574789 RepID=A0A6A6YML5_9PEZI|nr:putative transporter [Mytilinidion resinicola]KAF2809788.1 putative transporter [Mytilinidion resinicola]